MNKININQGTHSSLHDIVLLSFDASDSLSKHLLIFIFIVSVPFPVIVSRREGCGCVCPCNY